MTDFGKATSPVDWITFLLGEADHRRPAAAVLVHLGVFALEVFDKLSEREPGCHGGGCRLSEFRWREIIGGAFINYTLHFNTRSMSLVGFSKYSVWITFLLFLKVQTAFVITKRNFKEDAKLALFVFSFSLFFLYCC